jgi:GTPase involved in cell partitioning and DNA repair
MVAVGISVEGARGGNIREGAIKEAVVKGPHGQDGRKGGSIFWSTTRDWELG